MTSVKAATAAALLVLATACSGGGGTSPPPSDTLVWASGAAPNSLDIAHGFNSASTLIQTAVLDTMVMLDATGKPVPHLATGWTQPDPATYLFTLTRRLLACVPASA
ncbi:hypothetical protein [Nonomuraea sediminis]|uniref:hypothetical protein n=1 Tax=Nonomuraea sediminis TaxID=2835864 RepID=UPI001BDC692C|nr:hypothetical protein [Nonomuraea sediminis]